MPHERDGYPELRAAVAARGGRLWRLADGAGATPADLFGVTASGRALLVEVKRLDRPPDPYALQPDLTVELPGARALRPHQVTALLAVEERGGVGLLAAWWFDGGDICRGRRWALSRVASPWSRARTVYVRQHGSTTCAAEALAEAYLALISDSPYPQEPQEGG